MKRLKEDQERNTREWMHAEVFNTGGGFVTETACNVDELEAVSEYQPPEPITNKRFTFLAVCDTLDNSNNRLHWDITGNFALQVQNCIRGTLLIPNFVLIMGNPPSCMIVELDPSRLHSHSLLGFDHPSFGFWMARRW